MQTSIRTAEIKKADAEIDVDVCVGKKVHGQPTIDGATLFWHPFFSRNPSVAGFFYLATHLCM